MSAGGGPVTVYPEVLGGLNLEERMKNSETWKRNEEKMRKQFEEMGRKHPGWFSLGTSRRIGVTTTPLGKQLADYFGVSHGILVNSVESNSPADKAGLKAGDIITEADGRKVEDAGDLVNALSRKDEGEVTLKVVRDRKERTVRITPERGGPQGLYIGPGAFSVEVPRAIVTTPRLISPRIVSPRIITPRVMTLPRLRAVPMPRFRVYGLGDRIL